MRWKKKIWTLKTQKITLKKNSLIAVSIIDPASISGGLFIGLIFKIVHINQYL